jgi:hypothetical protein
MQAGTLNIKDADTNSGESKRGDHIIEDAGFNQGNDKQHGEWVLIQSDRAKASSPAFRAVVTEVVETIRSNHTTGNIRQPYGSNGQIGKDGHSAYVSFDINGKYKAAVKQVDPLTSAMAKVAKAHPGFEVRETGDASLGQALDPALRLRRVDRSGDSLAARDLVRAGNAGNHVARQSPDPDGLIRTGRRDPGRARGRRRLLALLSQART